MEPERYTQYLPRDLTYELALRLPWRELYEAYLALPEYQRYGADHRLWKELYKRDLSTYLLPAGESYIEQYFWGRALLESLSTDQDQLENTILTLTQLGYDVPLRELTPKLNKIMRGLLIFRLNNMVDAAVDGGYITILDLMIEHFGETLIESILRSAIHLNHVDVFNHYLPKLDSNRLGSLLTMAAIEGREDILETLMEHARSFGYNFDYSQLLSYAVESTNPHLVAKLLDEAIPSRIEVQQLLKEVVHLEVFWTLVGYMISQGWIEQKDIPAQHLMRVALRDCNLEAAMLAYQMGAKITDADDVAHYCSDPRLHAWILDHASQPVIEMALRVLIAHHPEFVPLYLQALRVPVRNNHVDAIFTAAARVEDDDLFEAIVYHPAMKIPENTIVAFLTRSHLLVSEDRLRRLLDLLPRERQLSVLRQMDPAVAQGLLTDLGYPANTL